MASVFANTAAGFAGDIKSLTVASIQDKGGGSNDFGTDMIKGGLCS